MAFCGKGKKRKKKNDKKDETQVVDISVFGSLSPKNYFGMTQI
jgi:hypothetical protein